jgi:hypothetical protein
MDLHAASRWLFHFWVEILLGIQFGLEITALSRVALEAPPARILPTRNRGTPALIVAGGATVFAFDFQSGIDAAPGVKGVTYLPADVTNEEQVREAVAVAAGAGMPLRTVVNCAGIGPSARILGRKGVHDLVLYAKVIQINLVGTFTVLALASEAIAVTDPDANGQRGVIVNTASVAAFEGQVGQVAYPSSKGGVVGMTLPAAEIWPSTASGSAPSPRASLTPRCWPRSVRSSAPAWPPGSHSPRAWPGPRSTRSSSR